MPEKNPDELDIDGLLQEARSGCVSSSGRLFDELHRELTRLAAAVFHGQGSGHTLQPTALVHEAWIKISGGLESVEDKSHFFALAAKAMRQVLADHARAKNAEKRGGGFQRVTLSTGVLTAEHAGYDAVAFHDALDRLSSLNERYGRIAEMRVLGSLTLEEIAKMLDISVSTAWREWQAVRLWLIRETAGHDV